jgi:hypothetical protein
MPSLPASDTMTIVAAKPKSRTNVHASTIVQQPQQQQQPRRRQKSLSAGIFRKLGVVIVLLSSVSIILDQVGRGIEDMYSIGTLSKQGDTDTDFHNNANYNTTIGNGRLLPAFGTGSSTRNEDRVVERQSTMTLYSQAATQQKLNTMTPASKTFPPIDVLATAAQDAPLARHYLDGESLMVFADHSSTAKNDVSSQNMHCVNVDNMTCASHDEKHPDWMNECNQNPYLPQCQLECYDDAPDAYQNTTLRESQVDAARFNNSSSVSGPFYSLWPSIDQGEWIEDPEYCLATANTTSNCLLDKYRFRLRVQGRNNFETRSGQEACDLLHKHNISDISFIGDSLIRHLTMGLIMVLEDDWNRIFHPTKKGLGCTGDVAFSEKGCRMSSFDMQVCRDQESGRAIHFRSQQHNPTRKKHTPPISRGGGKGKTLHVYGVGNHPATGIYTEAERLGVLNLEAYKKTKWITFQEKEFWGKGDYFLWLPPHFKMNIHGANENNQRGMQFMEESHDFFSKLGASTLNTYSMTKAASRFLYRGSLPLNATLDKQGYFSRETCQPISDTWDGFHYARTINVWKAHLLLDRVARLFQ